MGIYEKLQFRKIGILVVEFITWTRLYGIKDAIYLCRKFLFKKKDGYKIKASFLPYPVKLRDNYSDKAIFFQVFFDKQYYLYARQLNNAATIIDGGANIGMASVYFLSIFPTAKIAAIEPDGGNFEVLKENVSNYKNVKCFQNAIWHCKESLSIKNPDTYAAGYMVGKSGADATTTFQGFTINDILQINNWTSADIVKLDIEGAEKEVFSLGDNGWIATTKLIIIELHDNYKEGCTKSFFNALQPYEYSAFFHHENIFVFIEGPKKG